MSVAGRPGRTGRRLAIGMAATAATAAAAVAAERALVRRARSGPDPARGEPFGQRPGTESRIRSFDGTELVVATVGEDPGGGAPTLVFSHGFSLDLTVWHYQWRRFSRGHRCVLYDHRGHGRSDRPASGDYSLDALGLDLKAVLDATVPTGPAVVIGHSMGGMAILSLGALHPEEFGSRIAGVVLANTAAVDLLKEAAGGLLVRAAAAARGSLLQLGTRPTRVDWVRKQAGGRGAGLAFLVARATNFGRDAPPSLIDFVTRVSVATPSEVWTDLAPSLLEMDLVHALEHVTAPTLVLVGDVDRLTPPTSAEAMVRVLPDARLHVIEGAGHCAMLERHDEFDGAIEALLRDLSASDPDRTPVEAERT